MTTKRLLLPFTQGIDMRAIEQAVQIAKYRKAQLIPLALIHVSSENKRTRLEYIQQAQDFLEAARWKARKHGVLLECLEIYTPNAVKSIGIMAREKECDGVLLFSSYKSNALLQRKEKEQLVEAGCYNLYVIHLCTMPQESALSRLARLLCLPLVEKGRQLSGLLQKLERRVPAARSSLIEADISPSPIEAREKTSVGT